jgi:uncharacterized protein with von Willebrand factor type A (vWA) domain
MSRYRYGRWDGTQQFEPFTAADIMEHLADQVLDDGDLWSAMRDLLQRGGQLPSGRNMSGLRDLLERLRDRRQQLQQRYNMDSVLGDIREKLDQIVDTERQGIEKRLEANKESDADSQLREMLDNMAKKRQDQLDALPKDVGGQIQSLRDYDFMDPDARDQFNELLDSLRQQVMQQYFQGLKQGAASMTPEMMRQIQQMVQDLNQLLDEHQHGDDSGFEDFMKKWGQFFPDGIQNIDQLSNHLQQQMAAMQALLDSMTPEMRQELNDMLAPLFNNPELQNDLMQLMSHLDRMFPERRGDGQQFSGDEPITLQEAMRLMGEMGELEELEQELIDAAKRNDASNLDADRVGRLIDDEARRMAEELRDFIKMLEEAGLIQRNGKQWSLTPRAMRKVAERALEQIFDRAEGGLAGEHTLTRLGWGLEMLDDTKPYAFGDPLTIDIPGTMMNALRRQGSGTPLRLTQDDFDVYQTASINQCSTVILLDMSYSMLRGGRFIAGRKVALALDSLIRTKFPRDTLHVAAFSYFVLPLESHMLLDTYWIDPRGTDFPEALRQARGMLSKRHGGTKQIIMITDGEPHANAWGFGSYDGGWSMRQAMDDTLREVSRCTREGITVNTFMLDTEPVVTTFIKAMTKINSGRIFFADPGDLGKYLIVDYVKNRRRAG